MTGVVDRPPDKGKVSVGNVFSSVDKYMYQGFDKLTLNENKSEPRSFSVHSRDLPAKPGQNDTHLKSEKMDSDKIKHEANENRIVDFTSKMSPIVEELNAEKKNDLVKDSAEKPSASYSDTLLCKDKRDILAVDSDVFQDRLSFVESRKQELLHKHVVVSPKTKQE